MTSPQAWSCASIAAFSAKQVNFGASDVPMNATERSAAAANGYVPLPPQIRALAHTALAQITGPGGTHLLD